ncbi:carboxypeptidase inhibitor SmCI-like [Scyliorhinus canicula]|uniref:carboxypeptidase inhibitor SmCI-like n=1 Tax=Scyliorhinus canicula TaxID=7830 RepID=UPI0018F3A641|nr:carboxypeptidase inhibitor SmCI-like [Scyliorhinus canicula]
MQTTLYLCRSAKRIANLQMLHGTLCIYLDDQACSLPRVVGRCRGSFIRFYYNQNTQACEQFTYGGCGGNANNFETMTACQTNCQPAYNHVCFLPRVVGRCRARFIRFYYNNATTACEEFTYGGCGGNTNNFVSMSECQRNCPTVDDHICSMPREVGSCRASITRYYYNSATNACEQFTYGGCRGNANNFETMSECQTNCPPAGCFAPAQRHQDPGTREQTTILEFF